MRNDGTTHSVRYVDDAGDAHPGNMFYQEESKQFTWIDFQTVHKGPPGWELSQGLVSLSAFVVLVLDEDAIASSEATLPLPFRNLTILSRLNCLYTITLRNLTGCSSAVWRVRVVTVYWLPINQYSL